MGSSLRRERRLWSLENAFVLTTCFVAGLLSAGVVAVAGPLGAAVAGTTGPDSPAATEPFLVQFEAGTPAQTQGEILAAAGAEELSYVAPLRIHGVLLPGGDALTASLDALKSNTAVTTVEANREREAGAVPSDPSYADQWSLPKIGWDQAYGTVAPGGTARVAILDTGVDGSHPDLDGNLVPGTSVLDGSDGLTDPNGHGTAMAGIVAAETGNGDGIAGVGYAGVEVLPVTVLGADGTGEDGDIIEGVVYATQHDADVILMSFSNPGYSELLQEAIDYAWNEGAVVVAAAGNDGSSSPTFPAGDRGVVGISNTDQNDSLSDTSNYGQAVFLAAPGSDVVTTAAGGGTAAISGTSAAAAHVAGAAALLKAASGAANGVIVSRLAMTAARAGAQEQTGNGRLDLARALADTSTDSIQPAGADPVGEGGPLVGPYVVAADKNWNGSVSTNWFNASNWSPSGVPSISQSVEIPVVAANRYPSVASGAATAKSIDLKSGASLTQSGGTLTIGTAASNGDVVVEGSLIQLGGTFDATFSPKVILTGSGSASQSGGTLLTKLLEVTGGRTFTQSGASPLVRILEEYKNAGTFTASAGTIEFSPNDGTGTWGSTAGSNVFFNAVVPTTKSQPFGSSFQLKGDWTNNGTATISSGVTTTFNGTGAQVVGGSSVTSFRSLIVNKTGGDLTLGVNANVVATLTFTQGNVVTDENVLIVTSTGSVNRTSGHVVGNLQRTVATGNPAAIVYQVGTASAYTPVTVDVDGSGGTAGGLIARTDGVAHAQIGTSGLDTAKDVERFWTLAPAGAALGARTYKLTVQFLAADVPGGANTSAFEFRRYDGTWHTPTGGVYARTGTTTMYSTFGAFSDFVVGEVAPANTSPATPANLAQFRTDGSTPIALGAFTNETTVVLKGDLSDPDLSDMVKLEVEVKPVGTAFDGSGLVSGSLVTDPATASATVTGLAHGLGYHWRARAVDDDNAASGWLSFGGNGELDSDFTVDTAKPTVTASATSPPAGPAYVAGTWTNQNVRVAFDCQDALSGIAADTVLDVTVSTDGADQSVTSTGSCTDAAGNTADAATFSDIDLDKTAPVDVATLLERTPDHNGWYNAPVDWETSGDDATSGIASCSSGTYSGPDATGLTVSGSCTDAAGNSSAAASSVLFDYDATAPVSVATQLSRLPDHDGWYNAPVAWATSALDATSGIDECSAGTYPGPDGTGLTVSGSCTDVAGNDSAAAASEEFDYDATAPVDVETLLERAPDHNGWYNAAVGWESSGDDATSGIDTCSSGTYSGPDGTALTVSGFCTDAAGNSSGVVPSEEFDYDATAPVDAETLLERTPDHNGWYNAPLGWETQADDATSGVDECSAGTYSGPDGTALTVSGSCSDAAGNSSGVAVSDEFDYDATAPVDVETLLERSPDHEGWYNAALGWETSGTDATSGIDTCSAGTYSGPDGTGLTVSGFCTDVAGNSSAAVDSESFDYDATAPVDVETLLERAPDHNGWYNAAVGWETSGDDATSGIDTCSSGTYSGPDGTTLTVSGACTDNAGNGSGLVASEPFDYDATAPVDVETLLERTPDHGGWYNAPVDWETTATDATSGIDACSAGTYSGPDATGLTVSGSCTDNAGNGSAAVASDAFDYDATDPTLSPTVTPNPVVLNGSATATPNASDNLSGVDSASCDPVITSSVGAHSVPCTATDNAGNTATANAWYSVVFNFQGFFQPVDNGNVFNVVQAGRAIPVKFSLGGNQGLNIFASGYPASTVVSCSWAATTDDLEVTMTSGSSGLQYDGSVNPPVGQYIYVWKTEKSWASSCRRLDVKLADGTMRSAYFSFKK